MYHCLVVAAVIVVFYLYKIHGYMTRTDGDKVNSSVASDCCGFANLHPNPTD